jgi:hypothetical protein
MVPFRRRWTRARADVLDDRRLDALGPFVEHAQFGFVTGARAMPDRRFGHGRYPSSATLPRTRDDGR